MHYHEFYIDGQWVEPISKARLDVINPANEEVCGNIAIGNDADADRAVMAARRAFNSFTKTTKAERLDLMRNILAIYDRRSQEIAEAVQLEMGAPSAFAIDAQAWAGKAHLEAAIEALEKFEFETMRGDTLILREGIGVAALITPGTGR